ncbi:hypothetical protein EJ03DRAFT_328519 [Teratosphaeria nubilosa]|uniref:Uncharacterized protein n=1 Tax=Teratosphaeria nubilosa TaxID=161662 RepID=A0A6G1L6U0_9PEZI|nr:hypothetical protein EJ03DRAFT_328519 [Teratosphaeria nubilosa]
MRGPNGLLGRGLRHHVRTGQLLSTCVGLTTLWDTDSAAGDPSYMRRRPINKLSSIAASAGATATPKVSQQFSTDA